MFSNIFWISNKSSHEDWKNVLLKIWSPSLDHYTFLLSSENSWFSFPSGEIDNLKRELLSAKQVKEQAQHQCVTEVTKALFLDLKKTKWILASDTSWANEMKLEFRAKEWIISLISDDFPDRFKRKYSTNLQQYFLLSSNTLRLPRCYSVSKSLGNLSMQRFWTTAGKRKCAVFLFNLSPHHFINIVKSLFTSRDG